MFTIDVASLDPGVHNLSFDPDAGDLELDPEKFKSVHVDARLDVTARRILVVLDATATAKLECDRTLKPFDREIGGAYYVLFGPDEFATEDDDTYDEVRVLDPNDHEIDLTDVVRDTILLAVPQRCIAPGAEEQDLQTEFGAPADDEQTFDPRWNALKKLKSGASPN